MNDKALLTAYKMGYNHKLLTGTIYLTILTLTILAFGWLLEITQPKIETTKYINVCEATTSGKFKIDPRQVKLL